MLNHVIVQFKLAPVQQKCPLCSYCRYMKNDELPSTMALCARGLQMQQVPFFIFSPLPLKQPESTADLQVPKNPQIPRKNKKNTEGMSLLFLTVVMTLNQIVFIHRGQM